MELYIVLGRQIKIKEIWKDVKGYEGLYKVSNTGKVYSIISNKILKSPTCKTGYCIVVLWKNKKPRSFRLHRIVAENFLSNKNDYPVVNHKDGDKTNNKLDNLEYCTYSYNEKHAYKNGLKEPRGKAILQYDLDGNFIAEWKSSNEAGRALKLNASNINSCCNGRKQHSRVGKYRFKFKV